MSTNPYDFRIASNEDIYEGKTTDIYFFRTKDILEKEKVDCYVAAEFSASSMPESSWGVVAGINDAVSLLEGSAVDVFAVPEGTIVKQYDNSGLRIPIMLIVGDYLQFGVYETPILGLLCSQSGMVTRSLKIRNKAKDKLLLSFGARRAHPAITPIVSYSAYIGGCDGVSCIEGAKKLGIQPSGTIPHALIIIMEDQQKAWVSFDKHIDPQVPRVVLVDTYSDEKVESIMAAEVISNLWGVRLDTPASRKGSFKEIIREVRWELDLRGFNKVKIFVSGGLGEKEVAELVDVVDGFGIGSAISAAPPIDFAMDLVEKKTNKEWKPCAKRGKLSGRKQVWRCSNCFSFNVRILNAETSSCPFCGNEMSRLLEKVIEQGRRVKPIRNPSEIRSSILNQLSQFKEYLT